MDLGNGVRQYTGNGSQEENVRELHFEICRECRSERDCISQRL